MWLEHLLGKTEAKKLLSASTFSMSGIARSPILFTWVSSFLRLPLLSHGPLEPIWLFFTSLARFSSSSALAFLTPSLCDPCHLPGTRVSDSTA